MQGLDSHVLDLGSLVVAEMLALLRAAFAARTMLTTSFHAAQEARVAAMLVRLLAANAATKVRTIPATSIQSQKEPNAKISYQCVVKTVMELPFGVVWVVLVVATFALGTRVFGARTLEDTILLVPKITLVAATLVPQLKASVAQILKGTSSL